LKKTRREPGKKSLGFVGGGRQACILWEGLKQAGVFLEEVTVSDVNGKALEKLEALFPVINFSLQNNSRAFSADYFLASLLAYSFKLQAKVGRA
jgi:pyrroline-5-carboxylate reductase